MTSSNERSIRAFCLRRRKMRKIGRTPDIHGTPAAITTERISAAISIWLNSRIPAISATPAHRTRRDRDPRCRLFRHQRCRSAFSLLILCSAKPKATHSKDRFGDVDLNVIRAVKIRSKKDTPGLGRSVYVAEHPPFVGAFVVQSHSGNDARSAGYESAVRSISQSERPRAGF
jgi:hypothetical protein